MPGPWEKYQSAAPSSASGTSGAAPWLKYQAQPSAPQNQPVDQGIGRTALDQGLQGATFGLGDEISDRMGSAATPILAKLPEWAGGNPALAAEDLGSYKDRLTEARGNSKQRLADELATRPVLSVASNIAGGVLTGGAGAETAAGTALANSLRTGSTAARVAKGAAAGAASGAAYGAGTADEGKRLEGAGRGAAAGAVLGGALPVAGAAVKGVAKGAAAAKTGITARSADEINDTLNAIKQRSSAAYSAMRAENAVINRPRAVSITNKVEGAIRNDGKLNTNLHGSTLSILDDFKNAARQGDFTLEEMDQWRQLFGQVASNHNDPINARKASIAIDTIDDAVDSLTGIDIRGGSTKAVDALNYGRAEWARAKKFERIADVLKAADGDPNRIKSGLQRFINNPKKTRGFTNAEIAELKNAAANSTGEKLLKAYGKFGFDPGSSMTPGNTALPGLLSIGAGAGFGTAPVVAGGTAARYGQKVIARGKAEKLLRQIEGTGATPPPARPIGTGVTPSALSGSGAAAITQSASPAASVPAVKMQPPVQPTSNAEPPQNNYFERLAKVESGNNPNAKASTSSARGLYQFTAPTWNRLIQKYGKEYGVAHADIMKPEAQHKMIEILTEENTKSLTNSLGREPSEGELYMAHFLGASGAKKLINATGSNTIAAKLFPKEAQANRTIFFHKGGKPKTVEEVYATLDGKINS